VFGFVEEKFENGKRMKKIQFSEREREREREREKILGSRLKFQQ
jgi:hypothetical protein